MIKKIYGIKLEILTNFEFYQDQDIYLLIWIYTLYTHSLEIHGIYSCYNYNRYKKTIMAWKLNYNSVQFEGFFI